MEQTNDTTAQASPPDAKELVRPLEGRVLAGVSLALANRYDIPLWVVRVLFVLLCFAEGLGVALYAAGWLLIRSEDEAEAPAQRLLGGASKPKAWLGIVLVFIAAAILLDAITFVSSGVLWASGLLLIGVLLYTGKLDIPGMKSEDDKEGVQRMTSDEKSTAPVVSGDSPAGEENQSSQPARPTPAGPKSVLGRMTIGLLILGVGVLAVLSNMAMVPIQAEPRHYVALAVTILGLGLIIGSIWGRARWLILLGVIIVPTLLFSPAFELDWGGDGFDVEHQPQTFTEIAEHYTIDIGNMVIDLTELDWNGQTVRLSATVDAGNLEIRIPNAVGITGMASVDVGRVSADGRSSSGVGNPSLTFDEPGDLGNVILDVHVDVGAIDIDADN
ncbi:MAG: PspC domain-containing protein [Acidimicrobiia bacterium]|nr:PspC domain-containing protein [Acidimicrobiia bacterium]